MRRRLPSERLTGARLYAASAFGLLTLVAELAGRSLTARIDVGRHVRAPSYAGADYYPFLLAFVKMGVALLAAGLAWRFVKARATANAGRALLTALGAPPIRRAPRVRLALSPRLWLAFFVLTALVYLAQTQAEQGSSGRWAPLEPWLHTSALPVFAVLAVLAALAWSVVGGWLADYERYARVTAARARSLAAAASLPAGPSAAFAGGTPRRLYGLAFEARPPPARA